MIPLEEKTHGRSKLRDGRFTVLCNALCIAIINKKAGSIWQLFGSHMPIEGSEKGDIADGDMSADFMP